MGYAREPLLLLLLLALARPTKAGRGTDMCSLPLQNPSLCNHP